MIRGVALAFYGFVLLFLGLFQGDALDLSMNVASDVLAGEQFDVTVTVAKGDLESFARFHARLPRGLSAVSGESENAAFRFEDQQVKFVWMRLPHASEFQLKYTVRVDERLRGDFSLGGTMQYIVDNTRREAHLKEVGISIRPSPNVALDRQLDLAAYQQSIPAQRSLDVSTSRVRCIRESPTLLGEGDDLVVRILVNRGEALKFAKIEEYVPQGYIAEPMETHGAIFSFEGGVVKFLWMALPTEPMFTVSYRLIPERGISSAGLQIRGSFSFVHEEATRTIQIAQRDVRIQGMSAEDLERLVRTVPAVTASAGVSGGTLEPQGESEGGFRIPVRYEEISAARGGRRRVRVREISMDAYQLTPESGVYYRVQVAAGHRPVDVNRYFKRLKLHADVRTERHEGWHKYSVGSFREYKEARDYRTQVWATTPIRDAFVAAYNNGQRITVQEALMITSQKWYR